MALEAKKLKNGITTLLIIAALFVGVWVVVRDVGQKDNPENPFEYSVDEFTRTDPADICYTEIEPIKPNKGQLTAVAVGPDDKVYTAGEKFVTVVQNGRNVFSLTLPSTPGCIAVDENGDIYAGMTGEVGVYGPDGQKSVWKTGVERSIITSIAVDEQDVFIADAGQKVVLRFDKSGRLLGRIGEKDKSRDIPGFVIPSPYFDVALDRSGFLWAVNPGRLMLQNFTISGDLRSFWGKPSFKIDGFAGCCNPTHIALLPDGSFVTSEKGIPRVKIYDAAGQFRCVVAGPEFFEKETTGLDIAADHSGHVYVLDPRKNAVRVFMRKENS